MSGVIPFVLLIWVVLGFHLSVLRQLDKINAQLDRIEKEKEEE